MKILVTGSSGFIGQAVCAELLIRGDDPVQFDRPDDIRNKVKVAAALKDCQGVINLAGVLGTSEIFGGEYRAADINILGALHVMDCARALDVPMVQIATGHEGQPNPYAITKKCITDLALARAQWIGQKITVVRAYHVYGPGQKMCAPHGKSQVKKIVPSFVCRALTNMPLEINGSGKQLIDLVYITDVAKVIVDALDGPYGKVVEAGTGVPTSVIDTAKTIIETCSSKSKLVYVGMRDGEPEDAIVKAAVPMCVHPWPFMLEDTIEWYRAQIVDEAVGHATWHKREAA